MKSCWSNPLPRSIAVLLILGTSLAFSAPDAFPRFVDVAAKVGITLMNICGGTSKDYIVEANGNGAAFFDYDNDGNMDVLIVNGSTLDNYKKGGDPMVALYKNIGGTFVDVTREAGLLKRGWGMGVCVGDYNNDGYQDLYITAYGPGVLFRNNGNGTFTDVTASAGVAERPLEHQLRVRRLRPRRKPRPLRRELHDLRRKERPAPRQRSEMPVPGH